MIVVTGTKRSGTSMWMQVLKAAGLPVIGEAFSQDWKTSIREANPRGFFESKLRMGVWYATNPDPQTGAYLHPRATQHHTVKVFIPGLVRTDFSYLHRVIATLRDWRAYTSSLLRLYDMEDRHLAARPLKEGETEEKRREEMARIQARRGSLPPPVEWWFENYDLVRDVATRRYSFHFVSYERLLADPEAEVRKVLAWIGRGDTEAAVRAVEPSLRTQVRPEIDTEDMLPAGAVDVFDDFYASIHTARTLDPRLVERMNALHQEMEARFGAAVRKVEPVPADLEPETHT